MISRKMPEFQGITLIISRKMPEFQGVALLISKKLPEFQGVTLLISRKPLELYIYIFNKNASATQLKYMTYKYSCYYVNYIYNLLKSLKIYANKIL
jgi:hypothetical protein